MKKAPVKKAAAPKKKAPAPKKKQFMRIDARTDGMGVHCKVVDALTNKEIPFVIWADTKKRCYEQYILTTCGGYLQMNKNTGEPLTLVVINRSIKIIKIKNA